MEPKDPHVEQVLAEAETIRAGGASPQAGAPHQGGDGEAVSSSPSPTPDWQQYLTEAGLCAMYGDLLLRKFGCDPLGPDEQPQAVQAWAEVLAKWFPSVKEFMGPELRLLTIYGLPIAGKMVERWMSAPSPESSGGVEAARPPY